ncbi:hypothetical protein ACMU_08235 [Actibacterium mucosum KCTC 23349]|uniref:Uncharacterized protein n=1 Tax=Actibacterium mucosum KCTC 23349 TaxID=1454373 RepID=A0A037ZI09_9RHOB|nr:hypothetical protein ACMU_08235 [Actibacterium mucosum KCTC 23349]
MRFREHDPINLYVAHKRQILIEPGRIHSIHTNNNRDSMAREFGSNGQSGRGFFCTRYGILEVYNYGVRTAPGRFGYKVGACCGYK